MDEDNEGSKENLSEPDADIDEEPADDTTAASVDNAEENDISMFGEDNQTELSVLNMPETQIDDDEEAEGEEGTVTEGEEKPEIEETEETSVAEPVAEEQIATEEKLADEEKIIAEETTVVEEGVEKPADQDSEEKPAVEEGEQKIAAEEGDQTIAAEEGDQKIAAEEGEQKPDEESKEPTAQTEGEPKRDSTKEQMDRGKSKSKEVHLKDVTPGKLQEDDSDIIDISVDDHKDTVSIETRTSKKKMHTRRLSHERGRRRHKQRRSTAVDNKLHYDSKPRFSDDTEVIRPSGDFEVAAQISLEEYYAYMEDESEEESEESVFEEEEVERIDRTPYYEQHQCLVVQLTTLKLKNAVLQKKLSIFFRRRKMEHVLRETDQIIDTQTRYGRKLDMLAEVIEANRLKRENVTNDLNDFKEKRDKKSASLIKYFIDMQNREKEVGMGLINTKTGNAIPDKLVERLLRRQRIQMEQICAMRLKYIILKDMVAEKQDAIAALDNIGEGLHLRDYEQLKVENRSHADKIEEKEEELTRLRFKCQNTIQILAHIREKSAAMDNDIEDLKDELQMANMMCFSAREKLNSVKQERDRYRAMIYKLRSESGLLTEPDLLRDMEESMEELKSACSELEQLKEESKIKTIQIRNIRKNIEIASEDTFRKASKLVLDKSMSKPTLYKGRPSLFEPTIPDSAFEHLREYKVKPFKKKIKK